LPVLADVSHASPGIVPSADFVNEAGEPCQIVTADDGTERCAFPDATGAIPNDLKTYPQVVWGPL
jgi:hypothetical protein